MAMRDEIADVEYVLYGLTIAVGISAIIASIVVILHLLMPPYCGTLLIGG